MWDNDLNNQERNISKDINFNNFNNDQTELERNIADENFKTEYLNKQKSKLENIDLIEKNYEDLYSWKSLFSKTRPLSSYTHVGKFTSKNKRLKYKHAKSNQDNDFTDTNMNNEINLKTTSEPGAKNFEEKKYDNINEDENLIESEEEFLKSKPKKKYKHPFRMHQSFLNETNEANSFTDKQKKKQEKDKLDFVFPIALIDETEDKLFEFITIPKNVSERRKKMENFLLIQSKSKINSTKLNKRPKSNIKPNQSRRHSFLNTSNILNSNFQDEIVQASMTGGNKKNFNKTFHNTSKISQSLFGKHNKGVKSEDNKAIRPLSVYSKRSDTAVYYMCKEFSDYFKQDLKEFSEKFALLHPKIKCDHSKIKKLLEEIKLVQDQDEKLMKNFKIDDEEFTLTDLNLAGNSKNILPLLKTFLKNYYSEEAFYKYFKDRTYPISNRPLGNKIFGINNKSNIRSKNLEDLKASLNQNSTNDQLHLDYYEANDPDLKIFADDLENYDEDNHNKSIIIEAISQMKEVEPTKEVEAQPDNAPKDLPDINIISNKDQILSNIPSSPGHIENTSILKSSVNLSAERNKKTIEDGVSTELIATKSETFKENNINKRPKTAMLSKNKFDSSKSLFKK